MARGRLVSRTLGSSRKFADLPKHAGKLGEFAQLLYPMIIACSDDYGRMAGDAFTVKLTVFPSSRRCESDFAAALRALHNCRLIELYESENGDQVLEVVEFDDHQPGLHKRTVSKFPGAPGKFPEIPSQSKRTESKGTEPIQSPDEPGTTEADDAKRAENVEIAAFIRRFCNFYTQHRHGAKYFITRQKHVPLIRALLNTYGRERLEKLALMLLKTNDDWVQETDRGIGILSTKASWLDERLAAYEAKHGLIQVAS